MMVAKWLLALGGINWGLVGGFEWNLVEAIFGTWPWLVALIYILVGLSGVWLAVEMLKGCSKSCKK
ncbi:DUF378 domain-containing protein [Candidatus Uhrbacteria bacterium]|nr:DUF378 domain-containing protein [Candidatus Uhrbacteria bacterium]